MTPSARLQAAIELLDEIIIAARDDGASADNIIRKYFKARRYAGSKDRRAIRDHVYTVIRRFGDRPENGRAAMAGLANEQPGLKSLFDGSDYGPAVLKEDEPAASGTQVPGWLKDKFAGLIDEQEKVALFGRAALDIRLNQQNGSDKDVLAAWPEAEKLSLPGAFRLPAGTSVENSKPYRDGLIEIQDLGSQAIVAACANLKPSRVLDLCAGAGGKTLGIADALPETAGIVAADTDKRRLRRLEPRARRAGFQNIETILLSPKKEAASLEHLRAKCDLVLVDAPCSGTGTWRRNPELRWRMTPKRLARTVDLQRYLMDLATNFIAPGGYLLFATCSLLHEEGAAQSDNFLRNHADFRNIPVDLPIGCTYRKGILLSPCHDGTDGFYLTCFQKT